MKRIPLLFAATLLFATLLRAEDDLSALATQSISPDPAVALAAQDKLRAAGPAGLDALFRQFEPQITAHRHGSPDDASWKPIAAALNHISAQYDDYASGLYWYTDLEKAKAAAASTGRPILSLRLLGKLDTDLSCANSRFFRTTLYPNADISKLLRDRFILHWESVRPVPVVTIDFGDGRKLVRTITGNSIHYILDSRGHIVDALPGLYSPGSFLSELTKAADAIAAFPRATSVAIAAYQSATDQNLRTAWATDLEKVNRGLAFGQMPSIDELMGFTQIATWEALSALPNHRVHLDEGSMSLIANKAPSAATAAPLAISKSGVEAPLVRSIRIFDTNIALDSVRNNYLFRTQILQYLATAPARALLLTQVNNWVYTTIFLTPPNDPWFGLAPADAYAAIDQDGKIDRRVAADAFATRPAQLRITTAPREIVLQPPTQNSKP